MQKAQIDEYYWNAERCYLPGPCEAIAEVVVRVPIDELAGATLI